MEETFTITGMTCNGCRTAVENTLNDIPEVENAVVSLKNETARIIASKNITPAYLKRFLPEKYNVFTKIASKAEKETSEKMAGVFQSSKNTDESLVNTAKLVQLKPLFIILGYILITTLLLNYKAWNTRQAMLDFMGLFYIVFSFFKMLDLKGFATSFQMYDPLAKRFPAYAMVYPFIETALGLLFLLRFQIDVAVIATLVVLGITTIGVTKTLLDKKAIQCACLGTALKLPMTEATFIENAIMIAMAITMLTRVI